MALFSDTIKKYALMGLVAVLLGVVIFGAYGRWKNDKELARLRNEIASRDTTIEVQKGVYAKLALETDNLKSVLDSKDVQIKGLLAQIKKNKEDLLAANTLVVTWKKAYEGLANAHTEPVEPGPDGKTREKVVFEKDFGLIGVNGYTLTNPPEAWVKVSQLKPLQITLAISQDPTGAWHSYATSSDENTAIDIKLAAVNPHVLEPRWYENLQLNTMLAGGYNDKGFAILAGVGVSYKIKQFDVGPAVFLGISDRLDKYFGATFSWRPFQR